MIYIPYFIHIYFSYIHKPKMEGCRHWVSGTRNVCVPCQVKYWLLFYVLSFWIGKFYFVISYQNDYLHTHESYLKHKDFQLVFNRVSPSLSLFFLIEEILCIFVNFCYTFLFWLFSLGLNILGVFLLFSKCPSRLFCVTCCVCSWATARLWYLISQQRRREVRGALTFSLLISPPSPPGTNITFS